MQARNILGMRFSKVACCLGRAAQDKLSLCLGMRNGSEKLALAVRPDTYMLHSRVKMVSYQWLRIIPDGHRRMFKSWLQSWEEYYCPSRRYVPNPASLGCFIQQVFFSRRPVS